MTAETARVWRSPLTGTGFEVDALSLRMREESFRSMVEVRHPQRPSAGDAAGVLVWRLGPTWWLVDGPPPAGPALEVALAGQVREATPGARVTDVSGQRTTLLLEGRHARDVLAHGCSLDLAAVAVPGCVQGTLAGAQVVLARTGEESWRVYVRASFARHLATWLLDASVEYR